MQSLQYVVEGKTFPLRYPRCISEIRKPTQSLVPACREAQEKLRRDMDCYTELVIHGSNMEHWLINGVRTAEQGWEVYFCTLKSRTQITAGYTRNHFNTTPSALQLPFYNGAAYLYPEHKGKIECAPFLKPQYLLESDKILKQQFREVQTAPFISLSGSLASWWQSAKYLHLISSLFLEASKNAMWRLC